MMNPVIYFYPDKILYIGHQLGRGNRKHDTVPTATLLAGLTGYMTISSTDRTEPFQANTIFFKPGSSWGDEFSDDLSCSLMIDPLNPWLKIVQANTKALTQKYPQRTLHKSDEYLTLMNEIFRERPHKEIVNNLLSDFFDSPQNEMESPFFDSRVSEVADQIKQSFASKNLMRDLAQSVELSEVHLQNLFKSEAGITIGKYIFWRRFLYTIGAMLEGKNVTESAYAAGFSDASHFSRMFKAATGVSPSAYWKNLNQK